MTAKLDEVVATTCGSEPQQIYDGDVLIVQPHQQDIFHRCCGCGLTHHIEIQQKHKGLRLAFKNLGHSPDISEYFFQTEIQDADGNVIVAAEPMP